MMTIDMIPLNKLVPSPANVRKTGALISIEELAASIAAHGLLQNLQVRPGDNGKYEVVAGERRLAALKRLEPLRQVYLDGPFGDGSLFVKTLQRINDEQWAGR